MLIREDTIVAQSTPLGRGAIAIIRISGARAHQQAERLITPWPADARRVTRATVRDERDGEVIDEVLVTRFDAPRSYTGEGLCEVACHGGSAVCEAILDAFVRLGARPAAPGEFTLRAVLNGKLDLIRAEAVGDLIDARTQALRRVAVTHLDGSMSRVLAELRDRVIHLQALLAYDIDFPEEDDGPIARTTIVRAAQEGRQGIDVLLKTIPLGEVAREGAVVVIAGAPNVGKSSLFNALLGEGRAIVTEIPGTTRDAIEARLESGRWPLRVIDTAGLRESADVVERLGIEVSERHVRGAHVVLVCGNTEEELREAVARVSALGSAPRIGVRTKRDLDAAELRVGGAERPTLGGNDVEEFVEVSAIRRDGLDELLSAIYRVLARSVGGVDPELPIITRTRHRVALERAREELDEFLLHWEAEGVPLAVAAVHVNAAVLALDELIGSVDVEDVLDRVFRTFCVGK